MSSQWLSEVIEQAIKDRDHRHQLERDNEGFIRDMKLRDLELDHKMQLAGLNSIMKFKMKNTSDPQRHRELQEKYDAQVLQSVREYNELVDRLLNPPRSEILEEYGTKHR
uniref:Uncharacterized protein n=1 Tax=viral metagenome TaxID=1070528 RepID=A0A6C0BL74_9ZZZZ